MSTRGDIRKLLRELESQGWEVTHTRGDHVRLRASDGYVYFAPLTPGNPGAHVRNLRDLVAGRRPHSSKSRGPASIEDGKVQTGIVTSGVEQPPMPSLEAVTNPRLRVRATVRTESQDTTTSYNGRPTTAMEERAVSTLKEKNALLKLDVSDWTEARNAKGEPFKTERAFRESVTRYANLAERLAQATKPGHAQTINEVMDRVTASAKYDTRRKVLELLVQAGGCITHAQGRAFTETFAAQWAIAYGEDTVAPTGTLRAMERDGQLKLDPPPDPRGRQSPNKRTYVIWLIDPLDEEYKRYGVKRQSAVRHPKSKTVLQSWPELTVKHTEPEPVAAAPAVAPPAPPAPPAPAPQPEVEAPVPVPVEAATNGHSHEPVTAVAKASSYLPEPGALIEVIGVFRDPAVIILKLETGAFVQVHPEHLHPWGS